MSHPRKYDLIGLECGLGFGILELTPDVSDVQTNLETTIPYSFFYIFILISFLFFF